MEAGPKIILQSIAWWLTPRWPVCRNSSSVRLTVQMHKELSLIASVLSHLGGRSRRVWGLPMSEGEETDGDHTSCTPAIWEQSCLCLPGIQGPLRDFYFSTYKIIVIIIIIITLPLLSKKKIKHWLNLSTLNSNKPLQQLKMLISF